MPLTRIGSVVVFLLGIGSSALADWPGYQPQTFRWLEDYRARCSQAQADPILDAKCIDLGHSNFLSIGGEYRFRADDYDPALFGVHNAQAFVSLQQRLLVHADLHLGDDVRLFVQLGGGEEGGRRPVPRPGDRGAVDVTQAFADANFAALGGKWRLRVGRQEIAIGRFVAIRDVTNLRRTFDAIRLDGAIANWSFLAVAGDATRQRRGVFNDDPLSHDQLSVLVVTHPLPYLETLKADFVALEHRNDNAVYADGLGQERRDTLGLRVYGRVAEFDVDVQASHQFGSLRLRTGGKEQISAWGAAFEGSKSFSEMALQPKMSLRVDIAGGDSHSGDQRLNTFDLPYPNLSYLTDAGLFSPRNVWDVQPFLSASLTPTLTATAGAQFLWRVSGGDALYSSANTVLLSPGGAGGYVASQPYLRLSWRPIALIAIQATIEKAYPGTLLKNAGGRNMTYQTIAITGYY